MSTKLYYLLTVFLVVLSGNIATAQNCWKGGTPGKESDWNTASNWSKNKIPDWTFNYIIIPNTDASTQSYPIIKNWIEPIPHLKIEAGAQLLIAKGGGIIIDGSTTFNHGIINNGFIQNDGAVHINHTALEELISESNHFINHGKLAFGEYLVEDIDEYLCAIQHE